MYSWENIVPSARLIIFCLLKYYFNVKYFNKYFKINNFAQISLINNFNINTILINKESLEK